MTKLSILFLISSFLIEAKADIIKCSFTEPFYNIQYSMVQQRLKINSAESGVSYINNVSFQIFDRGKFQLWDRNNRALIRLNLNYQGSDGMSDAVYPYSAVATRNFTGEGRQHGGCTSNFLHER